jgi:hypothetical protein
MKKKLKEPEVAYESRKIRVFHSFEEMSKLTSIEILQQLRKFINIAYGLKGYDPNNLPKKHSIKIL